MNPTKPDISSATYRHRYIPDRKIIARISTSDFTNSSSSYIQGKVPSLVAAMPLKRRRSQVEFKCPAQPVSPKKPRLGSSRAACDLLSPLSDELLVRILINLSLPHLLNVAPVSRRFHRLAQDSQIWKCLYYSRFVLPRALRIPGFRDGSARGGKLHFSSRRAIWADGRRGGWVDMRSEPELRETRDWKRQYKLRHNWSKGKCAVEELRVGEDVAAAASMELHESRRMLVKVCEGIAITADAMCGLRAWDLKTKQLLAHMSLTADDSNAPPSCLALDDQDIAQHNINIAVGFNDGSFGVWKLDIRNRKLLTRYRHEKSTNGALAGAALSYPYLLTATESVLISLYTFDRPSSSEKDTLEAEINSEAQRDSDAETTPGSEINYRNDQTRWRKLSIEPKPTRSIAKSDRLNPPYLLTSLNSHTSRAPLALSIRKTAGSTVASIAYTFSTLRGWSLGIQDLHLQASSSNSKAPNVTTTRLAYTIPIKASPSHEPFPSNSPTRPYTTLGAAGLNAPEDGPISICYTHPYLLATLPDNTLILYLCTSNATSLSISPGIRLWGHTSGISNAEITARGKAVSVSCRGEEIRVWELEGRADGQSVEIRPTMSGSQDESIQPRGSPVQSAFSERRNWVGFDDEMVIVLKESKGRESLMVYDFT
jgi:hypothetical protein